MSGFLLFMNFCVPLHTISLCNCPLSMKFICSQQDALIKTVFVLTREASYSVSFPNQTWRQLGRGELAGFAKFHAYTRSRVCVCVCVCVCMHMSVCHCQCVSKGDGRV